MDNGVTMKDRMRILKVWKTLIKLEPNTALSACAANIVTILLDLKHQGCPQSYIESIRDNIIEVIKTESME